jgi:hypothetical protein
VGVLIAGVVLELLALALLLQPESLEMANYRRVVRLFLAGVCLVALGTVVTLLVEATDPSAEVSRARPLIDLSPGD